MYYASVMLYNIYKRKSQYWYIRITSINWFRYRFHVSREKKINSQSNIKKNLANKLQCCKKTQNFFSFYMGFCVRGRFKIHHRIQFEFIYSSWLEIFYFNLNKWKCQNINRVKTLKLYRELWNMKELKDGRAQFQFFVACKKS